MWVTSAAGPPDGSSNPSDARPISSSPTQHDHVDLTVRREPRGAVSRHIDDLLKVGDQIEAGGPVGRVTFSGTEADSIVLIAGGVGITPMMSITRYLTDRSWGGDIFFVYACRAPNDFIFANEIAALERANPKLHLTVTMSGAEGTDWKGPRGRRARYAEHCAYSRRSWHPAQLRASREVPASS
jgi:glycine betaine catabolism B